MMGLVLAILVFAFVAALGYLAYLTYEERNSLIKERLRKVSATGAEYSQREKTLTEPLGRRLLKPVFNKVTQTVARMTPKEQKEKLRNQLLMAGNPGSLQVQDYLAIKAILAAGFPFLGFFLVSGISPDHAMVAAFVCGITGYLGPDLILRRAVEKRQKAILRDLPDVLDLLTVSVEAGLGFDSALAKVSEKMEGALVEEFSRTLQEMRLGKPRRTALRDLADRTKVDELSTFVTALIQGDQLGVSIGRILRVQSEQMRYKKKQKAEEAAMKAPVKMLFPMIIFIFPTIFIILLGPAAIKVMQTFSGM